MNMPFHKLPMHELIGWPLTILAYIGITTILGAFVAGAVYLLSHLAWVPA